MKEAMNRAEWHKGTPNTESLGQMVELYLDRLGKAECEGDDQRTAAVILGEALRRAQNTARAAQQSAAVLALGLRDSVL